MSDLEFNGSERADRFQLGSGAQQVNGGDRNDRIVSYGDAGEPDPAQTDGAEGRQTPPAQGATDDELTGGGGRDRFEFRALINATEEVQAEHTRSNGSVNWRRVAGENDNVHDHWVEGWGNDVITDYSRAEGDDIVIRGHTVEVDSITYGSDSGGSYSLITVISQQGDGGAGGANTATGAHDEDPLGTIKVYGDKVTMSDLTVQAAGVFDGIDQLEQADKLAAVNGGSQTFGSSTNNDIIDTAPDSVETRDRIEIGAGAQTVEAGAGRDTIVSYSDGGEPDPAQTDGATGRVNPAVDPATSADVITSGQGRDTIKFNFLLNAKQEIQDKHTRSDGSVNWRRVAGENDDVHDHWVEGIGNDVVTDFSNQDGDQIILRGHTVEIASITYDEDDGGDYSLITVISQQGNNGGAHDEDPLGTIKVYGDKVTEDQVKVQAANVFDGIDKLDDIVQTVNGPAVDTPRDVPSLEQALGVSTFTGSNRYDKFELGSGQQQVNGNSGSDRIISYGDGGEPDPAQTTGADGRIDPAVAAGSADDTITGGKGRDKFEFRALINAKTEVMTEHTNSAGAVNWRRVAGENDNVHDHWVEGWGNDTITDYSKAEGDKIIIRGHTVEVAEITYDKDADGDFSLIRVISQQGDGGAGGANTATGAHDEDPLGSIKVYGDRVEKADLKVQAAGVFDGIDRLTEANKLADYNGGSQELGSRTNGEDIKTAEDAVSTRDTIKLGEGAQTVEAGAGRDKITSYADGGEPDPAQTDGATGRVNAPVDPATAADVISGGQGKDSFKFNFLLNAKQEILDKHTRDDGSVNWRRVAGENENVHDHWVEGIGNDTILDYSNQDGDQIILRGHTVEIAGIEDGTDALGDFSLISVRSQQGDNGGAHDEDPLGTIKVYGDEVDEDDIVVQVRNVFDGIDKLDQIPLMSDSADLLI